MTYGLVYKPINVRSDVEDDVIRSNKKTPNPLASNTHGTIVNIVDTYANETDDDENDSQNRSKIYRYMPLFVEHTSTPKRLLQKDISFQPYKVYENDSEIEGDKIC